LIADLKKYLTNYSKGGKGLYNALNKKTEQAIARSKKALQQAYQSGTDNPTTQIHELIEYLKNLKC